ncbi:MAG: hypothetical protein WAN46_13085 [Gammaproteobacteria bacterium]|jgi:hypothetical protein
MSKNACTQWLFKYRGGYDLRWKLLFTPYFIAALLVLPTGCMPFHFPGVHLPGAHGIGIGGRGGIDATMHMGAVPSRNDRNE